MLIETIIKEAGDASIEEVVNSFLNKLIRHAGGVYCHHVADSERWIASAGGVVVKGLSFNDALVTLIAKYQHQKGVTL